LVFYEGLGLVPPLPVNTFSPFFNEISEFVRHMTEVSRGANLVGMSVLSPDVCLSPCLAKKKLQENGRVFFFFVMQGERTGIKSVHRHPN